MQAYERVQLARSTQRPDALAFIEGLTEGFIELHGDRRYGDDPAMVCGLAFFCGRPVTVLALEKGTDAHDRIRRNYGSAQPEGYRKALWHLRQAEKFRRPVLCLIDTTGAACGIGAEERGQGQAIAENLTELAGLTVPVLSLIIGEGGSGGALGLALANRVWMLENAVYSVISPEGAASILWKDAARVQEASEALKLTAQNLLAMQVIDGILPEGPTPADTFAAAEAAMRRALEGFDTMAADDIRQARYARFRRMTGGCA